MVEIEKFVDDTLNNIIYTNPVLFNKKLKRYITLEWNTEESNYYTVYGVTIFDYLKTQFEEGFHLSDFEILYQVWESDSL